MQKIAKKVYLSLLQGESDTKATLLAKSDCLFYILLLGLLLGDMKDDAELIDCLAKKSNEIVFNDRNLNALTDVHFFKSFYANTTE